MRQPSNRRIATLLARNWWTLVLRGVIAILFGMAVFVWPRISVGVLVGLFGLFVLISGILALIAALSRRQPEENRWLLVFEGIIGIIAGVLVFIWPGITALILLYFIAAWAIVTGILEIIAAIQLRKEIENEWLLAIAGIASILFGILVAIRPGAGALAILWVIAAYAIIFGVMLLILGLRLRNWNTPGSSVM
ncbi:HdeD family acid-resistance protein [Fischerella sp. JS2]|uniref:HdeD family acid-resistance protein n=1 Tax=Fischerella sp. JS2 TaxID=2597771 RepID=UPI0028EB5063|nr:HdeD family acid-resistance protein [Fischerella sp. JS2]